ncbi:MAG: Sigma-54 dependent transcriptional regulator [Gemmatimonadetes bacterium]|nr:Sigma-54 dependent transcriptional regulator [Gemmatimonadota bacterium]
MLTQARVLLVSSEGQDASTLRQLLSAAGHDIVHATTLDEAAKRLGRGEAEVAVLADSALDARGLERLVAAPCPSQRVAFVVLTNGTSATAARESKRLGATEIVARSAGADALVVAVERAVRESQRESELAMLRARVGDEAERTLIGRSSAIARVRELVGRAAASRATVLITGEAGTGKDAVARLVHDLSERASRPYVTVRCGSAEPESLERELFGYAGSDTIAPRAGLLEEARGGTVVLDDASTLPSALRTQLARTIATRTTCRVGGTATLHADVRLILTSRQTDVGGEESREDLLRRFNAMLVVLPPLRERRSDIPQLVQHFRHRFAEEQRIELGALRPDEMLPLLGHEWTGNVRELEHWVERTALASTTERSPAGLGAARIELSGVDLNAARVTLGQLERAYILHVLDQESGHQSRAAVRLGIDRRTLYRKLKQYRNEGVTLQRAG